MNYSEETIRRLAKEQGFNTAKTIKPAHLITASGCPTLVIPKDAIIKYDKGTLFYSNLGSSNFEDVKGEGNWVGNIYHNGKWAELVTQYDEPSLTAFPDEGVCFNHTKELHDYLLSRPAMNGSQPAYNPHKKGLAWSKYSFWFVEVASSKPIYAMEQLCVHIPHIHRKAVIGDTSGSMMQRPMSPEECYHAVPTKWCVKITPENNDALLEFLLEKKDEYKGCRPPEHWSLTNGFYFFYPQPTNGMHSADGPRPEWGHLLVGNAELSHIFNDLKKHVLTNNKQTVSINTLTIRKDGRTRNTIEVQRPSLTVSRGAAVRATGIRCPDSEITVRSGHCPNKGGSIKG